MAQGQGQPAKLVSVKAGAKATTKTSKAPATLNIQSIPRSVQITMALALVAGLFFIKPYLGTILFSALIAFIFNPVYKAVLRRSNRQSLALLATIIAALLSVIIPVLIIVGITVGEASSLVSKFKSGNTNIGPAQVQTFIDQGTQRIDKIVQAVPGGEGFHVDKKKAQEKIKNTAGDLAQGLIDIVKSAGGAFLGLISTSILALFLILSMLRYQDKLISFVRDLSPFHRNVTNIYLTKAGVMTKAMVKGQLIIAVAQGLASAFSLWLVGVDYFWFFFVILTFLSFIPLGGGILTIPIGIIIMLTGNIPRGIFVILWHVLVVSNIDNILRPQLVPKAARLDPALTLLAVFSGIAIFGPIGVIYGPVVMILLITTYEMYASYNRRIKKELPPAA
jgi:predicted PurR-regulated permease PerM